MVGVTAQFVGHDLGFIIDIDPELMCVIEGSEVNCDLGVVQVVVLRLEDG